MAKEMSMEETVHAYQSRLIGQSGFDHHRYFIDQINRTRFMVMCAVSQGFASRPIGDFGAPALLVMIVLMFIGASSGSTGGGIKTSTFFVLIRGIFSAATNQSEKAFHYSIPKDAFKKAAVISILAAGVVITSTYILMILEPQVDLLDALFEMTSAFSTAGLSTGISSDLHLPAKILSIMIMFTGRLGPLTIASLWYFSRGELALYPDGNIVVG